MTQEELVQEVATAQTAQIAAMQCVIDAEAAYEVASGRTRDAWTALRDYQDKLVADALAAAAVPS